MSANIFGERFLGHREPAWHKLGKTFENSMTANDAFIECKLDYEMSLQPITVTVTTLFGTELVTVPDKKMVVREKTEDDPEFRMFGIVSPDYGLIQNMSIAKIVDQLTDKYPVETCGALGNGETIFATLKAPTFDIKGDEIKGYFLVTNTSDGTKALQIAFTPVRVVCQNTLVMGLSQARTSASLQHTATVESEFDTRVKLLASLEKIQIETVQMFNRLSEIAISESVAQSIFEYAYPLPKMPKRLVAAAELLDADQIPNSFMPMIKSSQSDFEITSKRAEQSRQGAKFCYDKLNDEFPSLAGSLWSAYNAVVECSDFRDGQAERVDASALFGNRAREKARALKAALDYAIVR